jgi:hypothetical protein
MAEVTATATEKADSCGNDRKKGKDKGEKQATTEAGPPPLAKDDKPLFDDEPSQDDKSNLGG